MHFDYMTFWKPLVAVVATIGLYTVLYKENKFYRFWEHVFIGLAAGWALVTVWTDVLSSSWWAKMCGEQADHGKGGTMGYWAYIMLLPIGLLAYTVYSKKHNWLSRIPIGIILGLYSGQQFKNWMTIYAPQISASMKPVVPNTSAYFYSATAPAGTVSGSEALSNLIALITLLCVLSYFLFSFDVKNKILHATTISGRWLLMIGFGAIFGSTVMMRFTLLIDRMYFIWIEFIKQGILNMK